MDKQHDIRLRFFRKGERITDIANALQVDRKTVWKYVDKTNFKEPPEAGFGTESMPFDPYKVTIDEWLMKDKQAPRKQRHTARRVFDRLKKEVAGFDCSYPMMILNCPRAMKVCLVLVLELSGL